MRYLVTSHFIVLSLLGTAGQAQDLSRYMGGPAELAKAPNGAIVNTEVSSSSSSAESPRRSSWRMTGPSSEKP